MDENITVPPLQRDQNNTVYSIKKPHVAIATGIAIILLLVVGIGAYFMGKSSATSPNLGTSYLSPSPKAKASEKDIVPTQIIEHSDWKTYSNEKISFKYPPEYEVVDRDNGFIVLGKNFDENSFGEFSVDTRLHNHNASYNDSLSNAKSLFVDPIVENTSNGVKVSGKFGPGQYENESGSIILVPYQNGAISASVYAVPISSVLEHLLDQIISTIILK